jgi:hypothetical protein
MPWLTEAMMSQSRFSGISRNDLGELPAPGEALGGVDFLANKGT